MDRLRPERKILPNATAARRWRDEWREARSTPLVFTNGVFDLLHAGHLDLLCGARALGGALIVGVNSDASVKRLKGPTRPIRSEQERAYVLAGLECVDAVVLFDTDTPLDLIRTIEPDVLVKGGDYAVDQVVGADEVRAWGGKVVIIPLTEGHSTTSTIAAIQAR
jgi:rfaE bifunctional protein nucleotidyltransferase chain/domain